MQEEMPPRPTIAVAGNPNVGKSTVFNNLTGLKQHTGNWPGKTVQNAKGSFSFQKKEYLLVDIPGTYSLMSNSEEEEIARDFLCFQHPDAVVVVADATCFERNLNLLLQTMELSDKIILCVNLLDEAQKKGIHIDLSQLSKTLHVPVVGASARNGAGMEKLKEEIAKTIQNDPSANRFQLTYPPAVEQAISVLMPEIEDTYKENSRWIALKLLDGDEKILSSLFRQKNGGLLKSDAVQNALQQATALLEESGLPAAKFRDCIVTTIVKKCEKISRSVVSYEKPPYADRDRKIDRILTAKATGIPIMLLMLCTVFWLTISGANIPSEYLSKGLFWIEDRLCDFCRLINAPAFVKGLLVDGGYRTLAWVISVMLPPMAIFFPLFTLLEDLGYLPRVAFNLDEFFRRACAHGKQALTMCMGFGCNACGVIGCRIIDSPRERLIAILTNSFVPCNGRFPTLIAISAMFFAISANGFLRSGVSALILTGVILLGVLLTLLTSKLLSKTVLHGMPSSFHLELPPYRRPQIGKIIFRSLFDRTLFVLRRAILTAAPAGLIIWLLANIRLDNISLLTRCADLLDPFGRFIGMDGSLLLAFILGFPANEIVIPILIMSYLSAGSLSGYSSLASLHTLFVSHGWTWVTAICCMLFSLLHWPCGTTCLTIRKETGSLKWTLLAIFLPTAEGILLCALFANTMRLFRL